MQRLIPAALVALALAAGACAGPAPNKAAAGAGEKAQAGEKQPQGKQPWWRLSKYNRPADFKVPWELDGLREGPGLLSKDPDGFVLLRKGEGESSDPSKPRKARR